MSPIDPSHHLIKTPRSQGGSHPNLITSPRFDQELVPGLTLPDGSTKAGQPSLSHTVPQPPTPRVTVYAVAYTLELRSGGYRAKHTTRLPHPHLGLHAPPAPLISPSNSFLLSTLKTGISASKCQLQLGEAGTHQGLPPRQIYRAIKLSLGESGRGSG